MSRTRPESHGCPDEAGLIARAIENDPAAVRVIMQRHNRRLYRIARSVVRDDSEAVSYTHLTLPTTPYV